jgi:hypothetical protein
MYSAFLKQQYELENRIEYDLVFKFRNDLLLTEYDINRIINSKIIPDVPDSSVLYTVKNSKSSSSQITGSYLYNNVFSNDRKDYNGAKTIIKPIIEYNGIGGSMNK